MIRTSSDRNRRLLGAPLLVAVAQLHVPLLHAEPSQAAVASAKSLVAEGRTLRDAGDHHGAKEKFKAAYAYVQTPIIGLDLAKEQVAVGELIEGRETCVSVTKLETNPKESAEGKAARQSCATMVDALAARIPSLVFKIGGAGGTTRLLVDGEEIPAAALSAPRKVNPGDHVVVANQGKVERKMKVRVKEGEQKEVEIDFESKAAGPPPSKPMEEDGGSGLGAPPPQPTPTAKPMSDRGETGGSSSTLAWVSIGVGALGLGVGAVTGLMTMSKTSKLEQQCTELKCPPSAHADFDSAHTLGTVSTVGFVVGVVGVGLGGILLLSSGSGSGSASARRIEAYVTPTSLGLRGAF